MSDYFPDEIIHKILLKLPVKSLIKFTLVSKSWQSLIKSSSFIQSHLRTTIASNDSHLLLISASSHNRRDHTTHQHHWLHWDSPELAEHSMLPSPVIVLENEPDSDLGVVGTSNGLVCLEKDHTPGDSTPVLIWNPSIRKLVMLPEPHVCSTFTKYTRYTTDGFGFDAHSNDYKILRVVTDVEKFWSRTATLVQVYSLARGSWKTLSASVIPVGFRGGTGSFAFVNGTFHLLEARYDEHYNVGGICTFNVATEEFGEMMRPEALRQDRCSIARYGDFLALISHCDYDFTGSGFEIWVMREYGVAESWTKLFNLSVVEARIFGFRRCGDVVLRERIDAGRSRLISYDPKSDQYLVHGIEGRSYYFMDSFVESLDLLDHCNAISYQVAKTE